MQKRYISKVILTLLIFISVILSSSISPNAYQYQISSDFVPWEYEPQKLGDNYDAHQKAIELYQYCDTLFTYYNAYYSVVNDKELSDFGYLYGIDGDISIGYTNLSELVEAVRRVYKEVYLYEKKPNSDFAEKASDEFFSEYYSLLKEASKKPEITNYELGFLIKLCEQEENSDGFYDETLWTEFQSALTEAKRVYTENTENGTVTGNTKQYWDLYGAYNKLCAVITIAGDTDGDGSVTILDVTNIQRALANIIPKLTPAQRCASCVSANTAYFGQELSPSIADATSIQRQLAGIDTGFTSHVVQQESIYHLDFKVNPIIYHEYYSRIFPNYYNR